LDAGGRAWGNLNRNEFEVLVTFAALVSTAFGTAERRDLNNEIYSGVPYSQ